MIWANLIYLGVLDMDYTHLTDKPQTITYDNTNKQVFEIKAWEMSNRLSLMFVEMTMVNNIKASQLQMRNAKFWIH